MYICTKRVVHTLTYSHVHVYNDMYIRNYAFACVKVCMAKCSQQVYVHLFIWLLALPCIPGFEVSQLSCPGSSVGRALA